MKEKMLVILSELRLRLKPLIYRIAFIVVDFVFNLCTDLLYKCTDFLRSYHLRFPEHDCEFIDPTPEDFEFDDSVDLMGYNPYLGSYDYDC